MAGNKKRAWQGRPFQPSGARERAIAKAIQPAGLRPLRVAAIVAHPDDETLFFGATLAGLVSRGHDVSLLTATVGPRDAPTARRDALAGACAALGVTAAELLGGVARFTDSGWDGVPQVPDLVAESRVLIRRLVDDYLYRWKPDVVVTLGADGITGHRDHTYLHEIVSESIRAAACPPTLVASRVPESWIRRGRAFVTAMEGRRSNPPGRGFLAGSPEDAHDVVIDAREFAAAKRGALRSYVGDLDLRTLLRQRRASDTTLLVAIAEALGADWGLEHFSVCP